MLPRVPRVPPRVAATFPCASLVSEGTGKSSRVRRQPSHETAPAGWVGQGHKAQEFLTLKKPSNPSRRCLSLCHRLLGPEPLAGEAPPCFHYCRLRI